MAAEGLGAADGFDTIPSIDLPSLSFPLSEDVNRNAQLSIFRNKSPAPTPTQSYRPTEQQLLREGKLGSSEFTARLQNVQFGTWKGETACLVVIRLDFAPKNRGWFRFRNATVEAEVEEEEPSDVKECGRNVIKAIHVEEKAVDDDDDDDFDDLDEVYEGPLIRSFYPSLIRGHITTAAETYSIQIAAPLSPAPVTPTLSAGWSATAPRQGLHLIHGRLVRSPETCVKWTINENDVTKDGIYEQPCFALIVRYRAERGFVMAVGCKATTYGGLAVVGKGGKKIRFGRGKRAVEVGGKTWEAGEKVMPNLENVDLENLTKVKAELLGEQGPGGGPGAPNSGKAG